MFCLIITNFFRLSIFKSSKPIGLYIVDYNNIIVCLINFFVRTESIKVTQHKA